jgi:hypothetical protein
MRVDRPRQEKAARTINALWCAIGRLIDVITLANCANMFAAAACDPE